MIVRTIDRFWSTKLKHYTASSTAKQSLALQHICTFLRERIIICLHTLCVKRFSLYTSTLKWRTNVNYFLTYVGNLLHFVWSNDILGKNHRNKPIRHNHILLYPHNLSLLIIFHALFTAPLALCVTLCFLSGIVNWNLLRRLYRSIFFNFAFMAH